VIQDAPVSGTPLSAAFLVRMAQEIPNVRYFKIEVPQAAAKLRQMIELGGEAIEGPWDGEEAITLLPDLDAGATGSMTGGGYPDGIRLIFDAYHAGRHHLDHACQEQIWEAVQRGYNKEPYLIPPLPLVPAGVRSGLLAGAEAGTLPVRLQASAASSVTSLETGSQNLAGFGLRGFP